MKTSFAIAALTFGLASAVDLGASDPNDAARHESLGCADRPLLIRNDHPDETFWVYYSRAPKWGWCSEEIYHMGGYETNWY